MTEFITPRSYFGMKPIDDEGHYESDIEGYGFSPAFTPDSQSLLPALRNRPRRRRTTGVSDWVKILTGKEPADHEPYEVTRKRRKHPVEYR